MESAYKLPLRLPESSNLLGVVVPSYAEPDTPEEIAVKMRNRLPVFLCALTVALSLAFLLQCSSAGETARQYQPEVGQEGKDVVWVPTPEALVA